MSKPIVVADSSPLIAFARIDLLPVLTQVFDSIIVPYAVATECTQDLSLSGAQIIQTAINNHQIEVHMTLDTEELDQLNTILDPGEAAAISLALQLKTKILIDEKLGRQVAKHHQLSVVGTAGVLLLAKQKKIIPAVLPLIQQLRDTGYYLSNALIQEVVRIAKE